MIKRGYIAQEFVHLGDTLCAGCGQRLSEHDIWDSVKDMNLSPSEISTWKMIDDIQKNEGIPFAKCFVSYLSYEK